MTQCREGYMRWPLRSELTIMDMDGDPASRRALAESWGLDPEDDSKAKAEISGRLDPTGESDGLAEKTIHMHTLDCLENTMRDIYRNKPGRPYDISLPADLRRGLPEGVRRGATLLFSTSSNRNWVGNRPAAIPLERLRVLLRQHVLSHFDELVKSGVELTAQSQTHTAEDTQNPLRSNKRKGRQAETSGGTSESDSNLPPPSCLDMLTVENSDAPPTYEEAKAKLDALSIALTKVESKKDDTEQMTLASEAGSSGKF